MLRQELELAYGVHFGVNEALTVSHDTPVLAGTSGLTRFTVSTHSLSTAESPFHSHASKMSSPSAMGVSGVSHINSPSVSHINAPRSVE